MPRVPAVVNTGALRGRDLNTYYAKSVAGSSDVTLTMDEASAGTLELTGALTGSIALIFPLGSVEAGQTYFIKNSATGSPNFTVTAKLTGQTGVVIERGVLSEVFFDGTDMYRTAPRKLSRRFELAWRAGQRGKPAINADIQNAAESARMVADPDFEILGTNGTSALSTFSVEGGIKLTTAGASADQMILVPHLDTNQSTWTQTTWGTDQQTEWEAHIKTGSAITSTTIWAGLKLTNTSTTATDDDQAFFRYAAGTNSGKWQAINSIGGTDVATNSGVTVVLSTEYHLKITIDASRIARFYIDGLLVDTSAALTDATDLIPYIGVQADTAAAKHAYVFGQAISRVFA